jgi:hypothetical protein
MTKRLLLFWLLLTLVPFFCFGQKDFKSGYIITNDSDTLYGLINLKSNYQNSRSCEFKKENDSESKTYSPLDIRGYRIENNKLYIAREISLNNEKQSVFLEYLLDGIVDLFYLKELTSDYYFIDKDGVLYQLSNEDKQVVANNTIYEVKSNQYKGILNVLFKDSPNTLKKINNTNFGYKPLIAITKDYHNDVCKDQACIDFTKSTKTKIWIEPNVGINFTQMRLETSEDKVYNSMPYGGINVRFIPYRSHYSWNLTTGITLLFIDISGDFNNTLFDTTTYIMTKHKIVRIPFTIEYNFPGKKVQPFLSLSYYNNFVLTTDYQIYYLEGPGTPEPYSKIMYQMGFGFDAGLRYNINTTRYFFIKNVLEIRNFNVSISDIQGRLKIFSEMINLGMGFNFN